MDPVRNLRLSLSILTAVIVAGTLGYALIEGWSLFDALYMTVITLATVGFKEVHELSPQGKAFTITLIIFGVGVITYAAGSVIQFMVEGQLRQVVGRRKMEKKIAKLKDHYIICGFGRIGQMICREFQARPVPFVVVEKNPDLCERLSREGYLFVQGNATDDDCLLAAGIERARGLITAVTSDTDNVYITLTARGLNPQPVHPRPGRRGRGRSQADARRRFQGHLALHDRRRAHGPRHSASVGGRLHRTGHCPRKSGPADRRDRGLHQLGAGRPDAGHFRDSPDHGNYYRRHQATRRSHAVQPRPRHGDRCRQRADHSRRTPGHYPARTDRPGMGRCR